MTLDATAYSISDLAQEFNLTTRAIRFYEDEGLLQPGRSGRRRVYSARDRVRLKLILRGKRLGFSLSEVRDIIEMYDLDAGETGQLRYFLDQIQERRKALRARPTSDRGRGPRVNAAAKNKLRPSRRPHDRLALAPSTLCCTSQCSPYLYLAC